VLASQAEVVRELVESCRKTARRFSLERSSRSTMQKTAPSRDHRFVQRFLHESVRERVRIAFTASLFSQQLVRDELFENFDEGFLVDAEDFAQIVE
jgi:hypothetical protein